MDKFYIGQKVRFNCSGQRKGTIVAYQNGIYKIKSDGFFFGMKAEDLKEEL